MPQHACMRSPAGVMRGGENAYSGSILDVINRRRILYWLAVMVAVLVVGTIIGLIWADTSNVAGSIAVVTNIAGAVGIAVLLVALGVATHRQRHQS
jgi:hypothetical protein